MRFTFLFLLVALAALVLAQDDAQMHGPPFNKRDAVDAATDPVEDSDLYDDEGGFTLSKRAAPTVGNTRTCTGNNFSGSCWVKQQPLRKCQELPKPYAKNVGSFRPDSRTTCRLFSMDGCHQTDWYVKKVDSPGYTSPGAAPYGRGATSVMCWKKGDKEPIII
ncbi:hypothetical protein LTS18_007880 [Coniosporium uncinatum]|uniref:Uncharacterized protein n=1 Tax=Coniosporium uncinatum TaxID=93489 RepID=A0ACC3DZ12_9PEZI|nr:hypothetical protein LTS18_007880 [Coniosporium uncinatum]